MILSRLTVRLHRFELLAVAVLAIFFAAAALFIRLQFQSIGLPLSCLGGGALHGMPSGSVACAAPLSQFTVVNQQMAEPFFAIMLAFPMLAGLFLGVPLVSREIERGTAPLPWTLDGSRRRWLVIRFAVLLAGLIVSFVPLALTTEWLEAARSPLVQPGASFGDEGVRGIVLVGRATAGFSVGVLVGLVLGRQLPGLIVGMLLGALVLVGATMANDAWSEAAAIVRPVDDARVGDRAVATRLRAPDGTLYTFSEVDAMQPPNPSLPPDTVDEQWIQENFEEVALLVPGMRYPEAVAFQLALLLSGSTLVAASCVAGIEHRRTA